MLNQEVCLRCYKEFCLEVKDKKNPLSMEIHLGDFHSLWTIDLVECRGVSLMTQFAAIKDPPPKGCHYILEQVFKAEE